MTTSSAEKVSGNSGEKEVVKRKALGRGLDSLLPGPRAVPAAGSVAGGGDPQVPHRAYGPVRNDRVSLQGTTPNSVTSGVGVNPPVAPVHDSTVGPVAVGDIHAVVDPNYDEHGNLVRASEVASATSLSAVGNPPFAKDAKDGAPSSLVAPADMAWAPPSPIEINAAAESRVPGNIVVNIALDSIDKNPYQTRYLFDREMLQELADSIAANGVVQPVVVRPAEEEGRYVLILGERRCRASKIAGKTTVPAIVKRVSDQQAAEMTVVENLQRQDLNCVEQAEAFRVLSQHFKLTQQEIGERVGLSRESVANYMRLLKLKQKTLEYLATGAMTFSEARMLLTLNDPEIIAQAAETVVTKRLSIDQIEDLVIQLNGLTRTEEPKKRVGARWVDPNVRAAQTDLERKLGLRVKIRDRAGKGKIVIEYATVDDFERVVGMLGG